MKVSVDTGDLARSSSEWTAVVLSEGRTKPRIPANVAELDDAVGGSIRAAIDGGGFRGRAGEILSIFPAPAIRSRRSTAQPEQRDSSVSPAWFNRMWPISASVGNAP